MGPTSKAMFGGHPAGSSENTVQRASRAVPCKSGPDDGIRARSGDVSETLFLSLRRAARRSRDSLAPRICEIAQTLSIHRDPDWARYGASFAPRLPLPAAV